MGDENMSYRIKFLWDDEAAVWIATSQDVPGLVLESGSFDALVERVRIAVPELVDLNGAKPDSLKLSYYTERGSGGVVWLSTRRRYVIFYSSMDVILFVMEKEIMILV